MYLVISDTHIGDRHSNINLPSLLSLLEEFSSKKCILILNGDIFDFSKFLCFDERHRVFIRSIKKFKKVIYIEGNHDWFVSGLKDVIPNIEFKKDMLLQFNNNIIRIAHGHQTDNAVMKYPRFARLMVKINKWFYELTGIDIQHTFRKTWFIQKFMLQRQEKKLVRLEYQANIIIAGHTHRPCFRRIYNTLYYNTGDWVERENRTYALIHDNGNIELIKVKDGQI